jgi:hypothetical protein
VCDAAESCSGTAGQQCPSDAFAGATTPCDLDANVCTLDQCNGSGSCTAAGALDCEDGNVCTQDACDPETGCVSTGTPSTECVPAVRASFQVKNSSNNLVDRVKLSWKGGPVHLQDFGDPTQTTRYELCVYDTTGVRMAMGVDPGLGWSFLGQSTAPRGYRFKDRTGAQAGTRRIDLKGSSLTNAQVRWDGRGELLPDPVPSDPPRLFSLPLTAQVYAGDGTCWEAEFQTTGTRRHTATDYSGKSPPP